MDYNNIDEDDVEKLRLAALMTCKKKSHMLLNSISSSSGEFSQSNFANGNSFNLGRNNRGRFPTSSKPYNKRVYSNVGFRRPHANNNLIAIIPTDGEGELQSNDLTSKNPSNHVSYKPSNASNKPIVIQNLNNEVSTKFSRLENESGSDESEDSDAEKNEKEESDDGDVLSLGEEDEDLDDLDKLMDIMEAEIAGKNVQSSKRDKKILKQKKKRKKSSDLNVKSKSNLKTVDLVAVQTDISKDIQPPINPPEEELESIKTLEEIRNSSMQCNMLKSRVPLKSPSPFCRKRSISPYSKLQKRSPSPRRRSPSLDRYRYSPKRLRPYRRSLTPRRSPRRLSPLREKNLSPRRYSPPPKSRYLYRSPSPRRRRRSVSRDISPSRRRLSPLRRRSRSKSRSPKNKPGIRRRSPSPLKKVIKFRPISPNNRRIDSKIMVDDHIKKKDKVKTIEKQADLRPIDSVLEARKRKFESNKPIEPSSKKIILKKANSVQVAIQTENKEVKNEEIESEVKPKVVYVTQKLKKTPQTFQVPKNLSVKMNNDLKSVNLQRVVKVNVAQDKKTNKKRPRIVFGHDEPNEVLIDEEDKFDQQKTLALQSETLDVSSASDEELSYEEEELEENEDEESEKEDGQESSDNDEECLEEEDDGADNDDDNDDSEEVQQTIDNKKECIQRNDTVDLRTELKRRKELKRLKMIQMEVKKKPESFYPARILQSAIRGVVGSSSNNEGKRKKHSQLPEISIKTEGNSDGRRVIVMNRYKSRNDTSIEHSENQEETKSFTSSVKRLKGKSKKVPVRLRASDVNNDSKIQKGLRKVITRNINVTDFNQM